MRRAQFTPGRRRVYCWWLCWVALSACQAAGAADSEAGLKETADPDLLSEMSQAVRELNYRGVMVYARNGEMRGLRVVHRYENGREQERIQSLGAEPREILRDDEVVTCILPKDRQVMLDRREMRGVLANVRKISVKDLAPHYELIHEGDSRLIDRECRVYRIHPQDGYRYGYRIWVDQQTSLPLRLDLLGKQGEVLEQTMFTQIDFPQDIPDADLKPKLDPSTYQWLRHDDPGSMPIQAESHWRFRQLPPGFQLVERGMRMPAEGDIPIEHLLFSDGLATVSVMLKPVRNKRLRFRGMSRMGAVHVYARQLQGQHVTVMGEVPGETVEFFSRNLQAVDAASVNARSGPEEAPVAPVTDTGQ